MEIIDGMLRESDKFLLLLGRFSGLAFAPIYNMRNIPMTWKVFLVLVMTFFAWQSGLADGYTVPAHPLAYLLVFVSEMTIGIILSLTAQFFFAAIQLAGQILDTQMGFGIMNVIDPLSGTQAPLLGNFKFILAMLVYVQVDGHHLFLQAIIDSFAVIPIGHISFQGEFMHFLLTFFGNIFVIGLKLAFPIMGALLFTDIVTGIISRTVPQMNIFMVGMPAKILLGFGVLLGTMPFYIYLLNSLIQDMFKQLYQIIRSLA